MEINTVQQKITNLEGKMTRLNTYYTIIDTKVTPRDSISIIEKD